MEFSHGGAYFGHTHFRDLRRSLAALVGIRIDTMRGFGGDVDWTTVPDPLAPFLSRNDAGGALTPDESRLAAARLREALSGPAHALLRDVTAPLLAGLDEAAARDEPFVIWG